MVATKQATKVAVGRPRIYATEAERQAAWKERHELVQLNVAITRDAMQRLDAYVERQRRDGAALTKAQVIEKLIRSQLLRRR
jgi:hypothetical protein